MTITQATARDFLDLICRGYARRDAVIYLANRYGVQKPAIYNRLRRTGTLPPYKTRRQSVHPQGVGCIPGDEIIARRVERDPCPRCGTRADHGCKHGRTSALSNVVFA